MLFNWINGCYMLNSFFLLCVMSFCDITIFRQLCLGPTQPQRHLHLLLQCSEILIAYCNKDKSNKYTILNWVCYRWDNLAREKLTSIKLILLNEKVACSYYCVRNRTVNDINTAMKKKTHHYALIYKQAMNFRILILWIKALIIPLVEKMPWP